MSRQRHCCIGSSICKFGLGQLEGEDICGSGWHIDGISRDGAG